MEREVSLHSKTHPQGFGTQIAMHLLQRVYHATEEQDAARLGVPNQEDKRVVGSKTWWSSPRRSYRTHLTSHRSGIKVLKAV